jgi:chromate transporter
MSNEPTGNIDSRSKRLWEVIWCFTQLGFTAFGGPAAHIGMMERQFVERRKWVDRQHFLDLVSAIGVIPGPNSTQLAICLGYQRAGVAGLLAAGVCFILPATLMMLPLAWLYVRGEKASHEIAALHGVSAAVLAVIAAAVWRLAKGSIKDWFSISIAAGAMVAASIGHMQHWAAADLAILAGAAVIGMARASKSAPMMIATMPAAIAMTSAAPAGFILMALLFLKIGATLYGSGYLLLPYLQANFVDAHPWLTQRQVLDAVAAGQVTPGPLLTAATFVGFLLGYPCGWMAGVGGALLATGAIFAPSFVFIAMLAPVMGRVRNHPMARGALDAMNAAVVAVITISLIRMAMPVLEGPGMVVSIVLIAGTLAVLLKWEINATWPIVIAGAVGWGAKQLGWM